MTICCIVNFSLHSNNLSSSDVFGYWKRDIMNTEKRIALACFLGATIGGLLALHLNRYLWWVGILIGGGVGYLSYCFKEVVAAVSTAWETVIRHEYRSDIDRLRTWYGFNKEGIKKGSKNLGTALWAWTVGTTWIFSLILLLTFAPKSKRLTYDAGAMWLLVIFGGLLISVYISAPARSIFKCKSCQDFLRFYTIAFPPVFACWMAIVIFRNLHRIAPACKAAWKFCARILNIIHSDIRLLCMTDSLLGALIGYYCSSALIGGFAGAVLGMAHYRLASRTLKLVKA